MEITPLTIYLFSLFDKIHSLSAPLLGVMSILMVVTLFMYPVLSVEGIYEGFPLKKIVKTISIVFCTGLLINIVVPNGKTMVAMYVVPKVVNNESVQQLPGEILDFIRSYLKENQKKE